MRMRRLVCAVLLISACREPARPTSPPPAAEDFTDRVLRVIQRERPSVGAGKVGPLRVTTARGGEWRLETLERVCSDEPSQCEARIVQAVDDVETPRPADGSAQLQQSLRPLLFGEATELTRQENQRKPADQQLLFKPFGGDLFVGYAFDAPRTVNHVGRRDLVKLGITLDELHARAVQNLAAATEPFEPKRIRPGLPFFAIETSDGDYDAARILLDEHVKTLAARTGTLIVAVPCWSAFVFSTSDRPEDLVVFRTMVSDMFEHEPHPVSRTLLRYDATRAAFVPLR